MGFLDELFGSGSGQNEKSDGDVILSALVSTEDTKNEKYEAMRNKFAVSYANYLRTNSVAEQNRMKAYSQEMVDIIASADAANAMILGGGGANYKAIRKQVEKDLNITKANVYDEFKAEKDARQRKSNQNHATVTNSRNDFDNSSSRMKLRPFDGQRLNLEGTVDTIEFADHDGQMQATIKNVSVATPNGTVRYNHVNFFVDDALGDVLLSRQGSKVAFSGKVTLYDRGHRSTDKGSAAKAYGFSDIRVK